VSTSGARIPSILGGRQAAEGKSHFPFGYAPKAPYHEGIIEEVPVVTLVPHAQPDKLDAVVDSQLPGAEQRSDLGTGRLPASDESKRCGAFTTLEATKRFFFPDIKAHTSLGHELQDISQTQIHFASKEYRLRSDQLAQTLRLFGHKAAACLPEGFSVQVDLSPFEGVAACDTVTLIHCAPGASAQAILEQRYLPFNGGGIGWVLPTDEAKNTVLKLEERLFYYKTLLAIKTAISNRLSWLSTPG
jgi:hypothetical protein